MDVIRKKPKLPSALKLSISTQTSIDEGDIHADLLVSEPDQGNLKPTHEQCISAGGEDEETNDTDEDVIHMESGEPLPEGYILADASSKEGSVYSRKKCIVCLDGARYTIGKLTQLSVKTQ